MPAPAKSEGSPMIFDTVIVGGGIIGVSIAHSLVERQHSSVAIIERDTLSSGSTGLAAGIVTHQLWNELDITLVRNSVRKFREIMKISGSSFRFQRTGLLTVVSDEPDARSLREKAHILSGMGVKAELMEPSVISHRFPALETSNISLGLYCPDDGYVNPTDYTSVIARHAERSGAQIMTRNEVTGIDVRDGRIEGVETTAGTIKTRRLVNAAGVWSRRVAQKACLDVPLKAYRTQLAIVKLTKRANLPSYHDVAKDYYLRPESEASVVVGNGTSLHESDPESFDRAADMNFKEAVARNLSSRLRDLSDAAIASSWAGLCDATPDRLPLMGEYGGVEGFYLACGFQGLGVMRAPAIGDSVASILLGEKPPIDISPYRADRFHGFVEFNIRPGFTLTDK